MTTIKQHQRCQSVSQSPLHAITTYRVLKLAQYNYGVLYEQNMVLIPSYHPILYLAGLEIHRVQVSIVVFYLNRPRFVIIIVLMCNVHDRRNHMSVDLTNDNDDDNDDDDDDDDRKYIGTITQQNWICNSTLS
jgi:hypothetical protein